MKAKSKSEVKAEIYAQKKLWVKLAEIIRIKVQVARDKYNMKRVGAVFSAALLLFMFIMLSAFGFIGGTTYGIFVDDHQVAVVPNENVAQEAVDNYLDEQADLLDTDVYIAERLDIRQTDNVDVGVSCKKQKEVEDVLADKTTLVTQGAKINVDNCFSVAVDDLDAAQDVLQSIKDSNVEGLEGINVVDVKFKGNVTVQPTLCPAGDLVTEEEAEKALLGAKQLQKIFYTVSKNDSVWNISQKLGIPVEDLQANNPGLTVTDKPVGTKLPLKYNKPVLQVVSVLEKKQVNAVPFDTTYKTDRSMAAGAKKVAQKGQNGSEEVLVQIVRVNGEEISRQRLSSTQISAPVNQIIKVGAAATVASRSSSSSSVGGGTLLWPTSATRISSYFGRRGSGFHTGLDIDGCTGDAVHACDDGKVVFAGYSGGYGYLVKVDHGNGMQTWYAHLSKISVSVGDKVSRGGRVGSVGSTGNSTGSHLHLEVRINGVAQNPLSFLR